MIPENMAFDDILVRSAPTETSMAAIWGLDTMNRGARKKRPKLLTGAIILPLF